MKEWVANRCLSQEEGANGCGEESGMRLSPSEAEQVGESISASSPPALWVTPDPGFVDLGYKNRFS